MNEETVKNNIVIPYFRQLGFNIDEIQFETSFTIKLGKHIWTIDGEKDRASGRLDLLYKKGNQNLFIVETKSSEHTLSDDDKKQEISYARLLEQIAPFAIVTNGVCTRIYDVITCDEICDGNILNSRYVKDGYTISL